MRTSVIYMCFALCILIFSMSAAYGEIDLSIPSPTLSVRGELYPDSPVIAAPMEIGIAPPAPVPASGLVFISLRASNFPGTSAGPYDLYLILRSADSGKTFYAEFDIMKLIIGGFDLSEAIELKETAVPFITDLALTEDINISIPVKTRGKDLSSESYFVIGAFTKSGSTQLIGSRAVDKVWVSYPWVCCTPAQGEPPPSQK